MGKSNFVHNANFGKDADLGFTKAASSAASGGGGFSLQSASGDAQSVSQLINTGGKVINTISSLFGGGGKTYSDCGSAQRQAEQVFKQYLTTADVQKLMQDAEQNVGEVTGYGYTALGFHYMGGDDCQTTSSKGKAWKGRVDQLLAQRKQETESSSNPMNAIVGGNAKKWLWPALGIGGIGVIGAIVAAKKK